MHPQGLKAVESTYVHIDGMMKRAAPLEAAKVVANIAAVAVVKGSRGSRSGRRSGRDSGRALGDERSLWRLQR